MGGTGCGSHRHRISTDATNGHASVECVIVTTTGRKRTPGADIERGHLDLDL